MSYYYQYYVGYEDILTGIIYPYGPYNCQGKLKPIIEKSRSFASDLYNEFVPIPSGCVSAELRKEFEYENYLGVKQVDVKYLKLENLPEGEYIKKGYFLIEDVQNWEQNGDDTLFINMITPLIYAEKLKKEIIFGKNQPKKSIECEEYIEPNASDYMYNAIPNYNCKEYEAFQIREVINMLYDYDFFADGNKEIVILETEG